MPYIVPATMKGFYSLRSELEVETLENLLDCMKEERVSMQTPLGILLSILDFGVADWFEFIPHSGEKRLEDERDARLNGLHEAYEGQKTEDVVELKNQYKEEAAQLPWNKVRKQYGLRLSFSSFSRPAFFQNPHHLTVEELEGFVSQWRAQNPLPGWNPKYAKIRANDKVLEFCRTHTQLEMLREFNIFDPDYDSNDIKRRELLYPFNGWTLAHLLQLSYETTSPRA